MSSASNANFERSPSADETSKRQDTARSASHLRDKGGEKRGFRKNRPPPRKGPRKTFNDKDSDPVGVPQPGKFPIVFPTTSGPPLTKVHHVPDPENFVAMVLNAILTIISHPKFVNYIHEAYSNDDNRVNAMVNRYTSVSLLALCQQICHTQVVRKEAIGELEPLYLSDIKHLRFIREITQQYGDFSIPLTGELCRIFHPEEMCIKLIRLAHQIYCRDGDNPLNHDEIMDYARAWWLPTETGDEITRWYIMYHVRRYVAQQVPHVIIPDTFQLFEVTQQQPDWHAEYVRLAPAGNVDLTWTYAAMPNSANAWFAIANELDQIGCTWNNPAAADLRYNSDHIADAMTIINGWADALPFLEANCHTSGRLSNACMAEGTPLQVAQITHTVHQTLIKIRAVVAFGVDGSKAAIFPPKCHLVEPREQNYVTSVKCNVPETSENWVLQDVRT